MVKEIGTAAINRDHVDCYGGAELDFLSAEFLRDEIDRALETILEYRDTCVKLVSKGGDIRTISFEKDSTRFDVTRSLQEKSRSLQIVKSTKDSRVDILIASNEQTKNGMFAFQQAALNDENNSRENRTEGRNDPQTFYNIFSEAESLKDLAY